MRTEFLKSGKDGKFTVEYVYSGLFLRNVFFSNKFQGFSKKSENLEKLQIC